MLPGLAMFHIQEEFDQATKDFPPFHSNIEGWGVIKEEFDELWEAIKSNPGGPFVSSAEIEEEARQVAAMAMRFLVDRC